MAFPAQLRAILLLTLALAAGCNLLDPVYSEGGGVELLVEDARHARASGDIHRAVSLLERALELDVNHGIARYELAISLMQRDEIGVAALERVMSFLINPSAGGSSDSEQPPAGSSCTFSQSATADPFDPLSMDGASGVLQKRATSRRVVELLSDPSGHTEQPALPPALTELNICDALTGGEVNYDRSRVLEAVQSAFENNHQVTGALVANAIGLTLTTYATLFDSDGGTASWFVVDDSRIGACIEPVNYVPFVAMAREEVYRVGNAILTLDLLLEHTGHARHVSWVEDALAMFSTLESLDTNPCSPD